MINKLVLGTVQLGLDYGINNQLGKPSLQKAFEILNMAFEKGINILDTAEAYGDSHEIIGKFHKAYPNKPFQIITKLDANSDVLPDYFLEHIKSNCKTLCVERLHGYMFHNYNSFKDKIVLYEKLLQAKENQLIERAGISLYTNNELEDVLKHYPDFDFIQIPFNLFDNASKRQHILERAKAKNIEIPTRSVFLHGLFFKQNNTLSKKLKPLKPHLEHLNRIKEEYSLNTETLALQYVIQKQYIDRGLIGVETPEQVLSNIRISANTKQVPHDLIDEIDIIEVELLNPSNWS